VYFYGVLHAVVVLHQLPYSVQYMFYSSKICRALLLHQRRWRVGKNPALIQQLSGAFIPVHSVLFFCCSLLIDTIQRASSLLSELIPGRENKRIGEKKERNVFLIGAAAVRWPLYSH
jgi:hypothetical protein